MTQIPFTKMHGCGNDYIYVDVSHHPIADPTAASIAWSDRHKGIGSDGLVLIDRSPIPEADFSMRIFNADGSEAMMCGNASRCIGKYVFENNLTDKTDIRLLTLSGIKELHLHLDASGKSVESVTVDMGEPMLSDPQQLDTAEHSFIDGSVSVAIPGIGTRELCGTFVSMGNPHFVIFLDKALSDTELTTLGKIMEHHSMFPQRCNIEFVTLQSDGSLRTRVWERGSGITMACGTGACATAVAAHLTERGSRHAKVMMDGGLLDIDWNSENNHIYLTGEAKTVYEGTVMNEK